MKISLGLHSFVLSLIFSYVISINCAVSCDWKDHIPHLDGSSCEATAKLALPFLQKEKKMRESKINRAIGSGLVKSIAAQMGQIADSDFIYHHFNADLDSKQTQCSLETLKENLPCDGKKIAQNLQKYSGGNYKNIDSFFDTISREYLKNIQVKTKLSPQHCMSSAMKKEYNLNLFLNANQDVDLIGFSKRIKNHSLIPSDKIIFERFHKFFPQDFDFENIDLTLIKGATFKAQLSSLFHNQSLKRRSEQKVAKKCKSMFTTIKKVLCSDIEDYHVADANFNKSVLGYNDEPVAAGFDLDEIEFAEADPNQLYPQFILNCPSRTYNKSEGKSVDGILSSFAMPFQSIRKTYEGQHSRSDQQSYITPDKEKSMCTLLACENFKAVDQGKQCQLRQTPRSLTQIKSALTCPGDDQCRTASFKALAQILGQQQHQQSPLRQHSAHTIKVAGLSSFAQGFITKKVKEQAVTNKKAPIRAVATTTKSAPAPSLGESISSPRVEVAVSKTTKTISNPRSVMSATKGAFAALKNKTTNVYNSNINRSDNNNEKRIKAMETQRKTMEDMLAALKSSADVQKVLVDKSLAHPRTTLPEISHANQVVSAYSAADAHANPDLQDKRLSQLQRGNEDFMARIHRAQVAAQNREDFPATGNSTKEIKRVPSDGLGRAATGTASAVSAKKVDTTASASAAASTSSTSAISGPASQTHSRSKTLNTLLDQFSSLKGKAKLVTTSKEIVGLSSRRLKNSGIALDAPFVIIIKDKAKDKAKGQAKEYTIPVRPSLYRGQRILTPLLGKKNTRVLSLLRKSPLFKAYFHYQDS